MAGKTRGRKTKNIDNLDFATIIRDQFNGDVNAFAAYMASQAHDAEFLEVVESDERFKRAQSLLDQKSSVEEQLNLIAEVTENFEALEERLMKQLEELRENQEVLEAARPVYESQAEAVSDILEEYRAAHREGRAPNPPSRSIAQDPENVPVLKRHSATGNIYIAR